MNQTDVTKICPACEGWKNSDDDYCSACRQYENNLLADLLAKESEKIRRDQDQKRASYFAGKI